MINNLLKSSILVSVMMLNSINCQAMDDSIGNNESIDKSEDSNTSQIDYMQNNNTSQIDYMQLAKQYLKDLINLQQTFQNNNSRLLKNETVLATNLTLKGVIETITNIITNQSLCFNSVKMIKSGFHGWIYDRLSFRFNEVCTNEEQTEICDKCVQLISHTSIICKEIENYLIKFCDAKVN